VRSGSDPGLAVRNSRTTNSDSRDQAAGYYKNGFAKHYVRDHDVLRFEPAGNDVNGDYGINKAVENLVTLREKLQGITERHQNVQQDILETFLNRIGNRDTYE
jgi:hypothetical protein